MACIRGVLGFGLACALVGCADRAAPAEPAGEGEGETVVDEDDPSESGEESGDCLTDDEGECVECRPDVLDSCAPGLSCVDWTCADLCVDIGGAWAGTSTRHWNVPKSDTPYEAEMTLELDQVQSGPTGRYTCPGEGVTEVPANAVGLAGEVDGGELGGWVSRTETGALVCIVVGEGHDVTFYAGELELGCTSMSGTLAEYSATGTFALTRSLF